jgi:outer membrane protein, heavy metal efflux system
MVGSTQLLVFSVLSLPAVPEIQTSTGASAPLDPAVETALARAPRIEEIIRLVIARNPDLEEAAARADAAEERADAAGGFPDLEFKYEQWGVPLRRPYRLDEADTLMVGLRQTFPAPGTLGARSRAGRQESKMLRENEASRKRDLIAEARRAYAEYYRVDREFRIHLEHVEIASGILDLARANYAAARSTQEDVLRAVVELSRLHRDVAHIDQERISARALLNTLMAREPDAALGPPEVPQVIAESLDPRALVATAVRDRPEMRAADAQVLRQQAMIDEAESAAVWPTFMVGTDYWLQPANEEVTHAYGAMLSVSLPWINPRHRDEVSGARKMMVAEQRAKKSTENVIRFQVHDALAKLKAAKEAFVIIDRDLLRQTEQSFEAARSNFAAGASNALSVLDALRMLLDARLEHENARAHWASASADLERAVGVELEQLSTSGGSHDGSR